MTPARCRSSCPVDVRSALLAPLLAKPLNQPFRLRLANLHKVGANVTILPLDDRGIRLPSQISPQCLIKGTISSDSSASNSRWCLGCPARTNDGIIFHLVCHRCYLSFLAIIGYLRASRRQRYGGRDLLLGSFDPLALRTRDRHV